MGPVSRESQSLTSWALGLGHVVSQHIMEGEGIGAKGLTLSREHKQRRRESWP